MFTIYHNPRCSKSRQTLALLEAKGIAPEIVLYLKAPPTAKQLKALLATLNVSARDLLRSKEPEYQELGLADTSLSERALLDAISQHPKLLERPIVLHDGKGVIGRPPENVLALIEGRA